MKTQLIHIFFLSFLKVHLKFTWQFMEIYRIIFGFLFLSGINIQHYMQTQKPVSFSCWSLGFISWATCVNITMVRKTKKISTTGFENRNIFESPHSHNNHYVLPKSWLDSSSIITILNLWWLLNSTRILTGTFGIDHTRLENQTFQKQTAKAGLEWNKGLVISCPKYGKGTVSLFPFPKAFEPLLECMATPLTL